MLDPRYEEVKGSGKYMTLRDMLERSGRSDRIDDYTPSWRSNYLIEVFWKLKSLLDEVSNPLHPGLVNDYCRDQGILLSREERSIIYQMDGEFRAALSKKQSDINRAMAEKAKAKK